MSGIHNFITTWNKSLSRVRIQAGPSGLQPRGARTFSLYPNIIHQRQMRITSERAERFDDALLSVFELLFALLEMLLQ